LKFLAAQSTPGVEVVRDGYYRRSILQQENRGYLEVSLDANHNALDVRVQFGDPRSLFAIIERVRGMFDLDADSATIARTLANDLELAAQVSSRPGLRVPGCWNGFEFAVLAVLGQERDREATSALAGRMITNFGVPYRPADGLSHLFPTPEVLALADLESIGVPRRQADAMHALSCLVRDGQIRFEKVADSDALIARLGDIPGIGCLAAQWIAMRALRQPDAFPSADPEFARALGVATSCEVEQRSETWRPWRAYAAMYFWAKERTSTNEQASTARGTEMPVNGSMVIDVIPSDIGMETAAIVTELVRNSHDAYRALEPRRLEEEKLERAVVISRQRNGDNTGQLFIEDNGQGQSLKHVLRKLQTSVRRDLESFKAASGPGGKLCSWPILSAGSKVVIESTMKGIADRFHLEINVRRICEEMDAASSVDDILRDSECISVSREDFEKRGHGTTVVIECDGKTEIVNGYKLNCFYHLTDPEDETLSQFLVEGCPIPYSIKDGVGKKMRDVYGRTCSIPTALYVDGNSLELRLRAVSRKPRLSSCKMAKRDLQAPGRPRYIPSPQGS
jgi:3-methyladenine DNA glycosylase/8-oxoguanine DNA glycosylase